MVYNYSCLSHYYLYLLQYKAVFIKELNFYSYEVIIKDFILQTTEARILYKKTMNDYKKVIDSILKIQVASGTKSVNVNNNPDSKLIQKVIKQLLFILFISY